MIVTGVGLTSLRYSSIVKDMNVFFKGKITVLSKGSILIQTIPIGGVISQITADQIMEIIDEVKSVTPLLIISQISEQPTLSPLNISIGVPYGEWSVIVGPVGLKAGGRWPEASSPSSFEVVIGHYIADIYDLKVGSKINIESTELTVVGILDSISSAFLSRVMIMPLMTAQQIHRYPKLVNLVIVEANEGISPVIVRDRIETEISSVTALTEEERDVFLEPLFTDLMAWTVGLNGMLFAASFILVAAISSTSIYERKREISTLYAMGAPKGFTLRFLMTETTIIGFIGGLAGIALGTVMSVLVFLFIGNVPLAYMLSHISDIFDLLTITVILITTIAVSFFGGLIPALTITRRRTIDVSRSEF